MVDPTTIKIVQDYLVAARRAGLGTKLAVLFGSHARGEVDPNSDIDVLIVAPEFDRGYGHALVDLFWTLRASTDSRIEPIPVGERQWREDDANPIIEMARREGQTILLPTAT